MAGSGAQRPPPACTRSLRAIARRCCMHVDCLPSSAPSPNPDDTSSRAQPGQERQSKSVSPAISRRTPNVNRATKRRPSWGRHQHTPNLCSASTCSSDPGDFRTQVDVRRRRDCYSLNAIAHASLGQQVVRARRVVLQLAAQLRQIDPQIVNLLRIRQATRI